MHDRDCSGYGVYEGAGDAMRAFQSALPAAPPAALRPGMILKLGLPTASQPVLRGASPPLPARMPRAGFRLVAQPARRRQQVALPVPVTAAPAARAAASQMPALLPAYPGAVVAYPGANVMTDVLPGAPALGAGMPALGFTQHGNLWMVDPAQLGLLSQVLGTMSYVPYDVPDVDSVGAHAMFVLFQTTGDAWDQIQLHTQQGFVSMVEKASVATGTLNILVTQSENTIAMLAGGPQAKFALITDQPSALVDQADQALNPAPTKPGQKTVTCPAGTSGAPPDCVAAGAEQASAMATAAGPSWWAKLSTLQKVAGVGAVALVGIAIVSSATGPKKKV